MTNPQKRKGDAAERAVVDLLTQHGYLAERIPAGASADRGDIYMVGYYIEVKNYKNLADGIRACLKDLDGLRDRFFEHKKGIGIVKLPRTADPLDWVVVMPVKHFIEDYMEEPL